jgi:hypothetical protein
VLPGSDVVEGWLVVPVPDVDVVVVPLVPVAPVVAAVPLLSVVPVVPVVEFGVVAGSLLLLPLSLERPGIGMSSDPLGSGVVVGAALFEPALSVMPDVAGFDGTLDPLPACDGVFPLGVGVTTGDCAALNPGTASVSPHTSALVQMND